MGAMEVRGPNHGGRYDAQHIQHVQRQIARSVKPNLLRELEEDLDPETLLKLLTQDDIELSEEAMEYLRKLRRRLKRKKRRQNEEEEEDEDFAALVGNLEELRREADAELDKQLPDPLEAKPFIPPVIQLSGNPMGRPRAAGSLVPQSRAAQLVERMIYHAPSRESRHKIMRELEVFGESMIETVRRNGVAIIILSRRMSLAELKIKNMYVVGRGEKTFDGRDWSVVRGLYDNGRSLLVVGEELLGQPGRSTARHEFAHAYDHIYSKVRRRVLPLSVELWNANADQRTGLVSDYAGTNPAEYFAESVEAYFEQGGRALLQRIDPKMYLFLSDLFAA